MSATYWVWTDGGSRSNPGPAAAGVVIACPEDEIIFEEGVFLSEQLSNNQAEYLALSLGLAKVLELGGRDVVVQMDSQLVVEQVNGRYKIKDEGMKERWGEVQAQLRQFESWKVTYVPRSQNARADSLVNQALDQAGF